MIALSDWVLWATHHAQSPVQSLIHPLSAPLTPSPTPSPSPTRGSGGSSNTAAIVVAFIALVGTLVTAGITGWNAHRATQAADTSAAAAGQSAEAANRAAEIAEASRIDLETRSKREELMRSLRWASELAVSPDQGKARLGVAQLRALGRSSLLDPSQQPLVDAALRALVAAPARALEAVGGEAEVVAIVPPGTLLPATPDVPSAERPPGDEESR